MKTIKGKIIRIVDKRTVIINLGKEHGIKDDSVFTIMGEPEQIIDPDTRDLLGEVKVVKSRVKAKEVADKFTIAITKWISTTYNVFSAFMGNIENKVERTEFDEGELLVDESEIQPWKAKSESPVKVGDIVQVKVIGDDKNAKKLEDETNSDIPDRKRKNKSDQTKGSSGST